MSEQIVHVELTPHSVELARNASGGVSFSVKAYSSDLENALGKVKEVFEKLDAQFPPARK